MNDLGADREPVRRSTRQPLHPPPSSTAARRPPASRTVADVGRPTIPGPPVQAPPRGTVLRLDLLERLGARVDALVEALPQTAAASVRWLADADAVLTQPVGDHDRARLLAARTLVARGPAVSAQDGDPPPTAHDAGHHGAGDAVRAAAGHAAQALEAARAGRLGDAVDAAVRSLVAFGSLGDADRDRRGEARVTDLLCELCRDFFDHERALQFGELSARALRAETDPRLWSAAVVQLAEILVLQLQDEQEPPAREHLLQRAEQLCHRLTADGEPPVVRDVHGPRLLAEVWCERGRPEQAWPLLEAASRAAARTPAGPPGALRVARARCLLALDRPADALAELVGFEPEVGDPAVTVAVLQLRSRACELTGDVRGALEDARRLADALWERHRRQAAGFMGQVWSLARVEERSRDLEARTRDLVRFAEQDPLTGLANRRAMERFCAGLGGGPVCLVLVDVDHFKSVNDRYGHAVGDQVLREVATVLVHSVRSVDRVARWGGEEFLVALPAGSPALGAEAADRIRRRVRDHAWSLHAAGLRLTVSAGVAAGAADDLSAVLGRADAAMYRAKGAGRDRVVTA